MENNSTYNKKNWITPELIEESLKDTDAKSPNTFELSASSGPS